MRLQDEIDKLKFDTRMLDINLKNGKILESDYQKHLANLQDLSAHADQLDIESQENSLQD